MKKIKSFSGDLENLAELDEEVNVWLDEVYDIMSDHVKMVPGSDGSIKVLYTFVYKTMVDE